MNKFKFTEEQVYEIEEAFETQELGPLPCRKLSALVLVGRGLTQAQAGKAIQADERTVRSYCKEYLSDGIQGILNDKQYRPSSFYAEYFDQIIESFEQQAPSTSLEAAQRISVISGRNLSAAHARNLMKRLGFKCLKPGSCPGKAKPAEQLDFFENSLRPKLEEAKAGERRVFFIDAAHFVRGPYLKRLWCRSRLWIPTASGRGRINVMGAVDAYAQSIHFLASESNIDAPTAACILLKLREAHPDEPITVVLDNAQYQKCSRYRVIAKALNIDLLFLPPYSPNLNIIERVWKWIKNQCLYNRYYEKMDTFTKAITDCLDKIEKAIPDSLKSMLTLNFQSLGQTGNLCTA